jgi:peptide/nickel transport system ATP-binding protein
MREIQAALGLTAIYISHDLTLVRYVARRTMVMYLATLVEDGPTDRVVQAPQHPYTKALVAAVPIPRVNQARGPLPIKGNVPDAHNPPPGCRFHDRCPIAVQRCRSEIPLLREVAPGHRCLPSGLTEVTSRVAAKQRARSNLLKCSNGGSRC